MGFLPKSLTRRLLPIRRRGSFRADERGATAIEFAILAMPFFAIIGAILETSMVFFAGQVLDSALSDATRLIRTGQAQAANYTIANFRQKMCDSLYGLFNCADLRIKVTTIGNFNATSGSVDTPMKPSPCDPATDPDKCWQVAEAYTSGTGSSIILVQVYYKWPVIVNFGGLNLQNQPDGSRLLAAIRVFRNEPFST